MYLFFAFFTFLLTIATILGFFSVIITSPNYEWPVIILVGVITIPFLAHKIYRLILEYLDLDFIYAGHDITPEEVHPWRKISLKLWAGMIFFGILGAAAWTGFILLGGPVFHEVVYRGEKKIEVMREAWMIVGSYSCYFTGLLLTSLIMGYSGILLRGWYFSTHATSRFFNTLRVIKNFFLSFFGKITGIEIKHEEEHK